METHKSPNFSAVGYMFKSYYVVWKPHPHFTSRPNNSVFKSYYVVWKLGTGIKYASLKLGLNRTMQYGNHFDRPTVRECLGSLNRTMQYGNSRGKHILCRNAYPFKSYYVVWKRYTCEKSTNYRNRLFKSYYVVWKLFEYSKNDGIQSCLNRTMQYGNLCTIQQESHARKV